MKTKLQKLFLTLLTLAASSQKLGVNLTLDLPVAGNKVEITLTVRNILNTRYYNHLSFYRKVEIPEPGRNFQLLIKVPFKKRFK